MSRKLFHKVISCLLCLSIIAAGILGKSNIVYALEDAAGEAITGEVVLLKTADDLIELSNNSSIDSYSRDKIFQLENDIDLNGTDFTLISIFAGTFEGNGHKITGFLMDQSGADLGFFRFVEENAVVRNLAITGEIRPNGDMKDIGGIAGTNRGRIENCEFNGSIISKKASGGIVGYNAESGIITGCRNQSQVRGIKETGGIAGKNDGTIIRCENIGEINASAETVNDLIDEETTLSISLERDNVLNGITDENKIIYAGGIAGSSSGTIDSCVNRGSVGYQHIGYKVGGIVGYQRGFLVNCNNYGLISGRKDIGGIAGIFEAYVELIYQEDATDKLRKQGDDLEILTDVLSDIAGRASDTNSDNMDDIDHSLDQITDSLRDYKNYYKDKGRGFHDELVAQLDSIEATMDRMGIDTEVDDIREPIWAIRRDIEKIGRILNQIGSYDRSNDEDEDDIRDEIEDYRRQVISGGRSLVSVGNDIGDELEDLQAGLNDFGDELSEFQGDVRSLKEQLGDLADYVEDYTGSLRDDLDVTDLDMTAKNDTISAQLDKLKDDLKVSKEQIKDQMDLVSDQIHLLGDTAADGFESIREKMEFDLDEDLYDDISDSDETDAVRGRLIQCQNQGKVMADINAGGIAGRMGVDLDQESEFAVEEIGDKSLKYDRLARATIWGCSNFGEISVKNSYAGGIVGRSDIGAVIHSNNFGAVETVDGDYAGGIAGRSKFLIRNCYVLSDISGNIYLGGICGFGMNVYNNYTMVKIYSEGGEKYGSLMGDVDEDGDIFNNYYVEDDVAGVNNLSYESAAQRISYEELITLENTPEQFCTFTVRFIAGDQLIEERTCVYGQGLSKEDIPPVPDQNGKIGLWENKDLSFIKSNVVVTAVYDNWTTTIASDEQTPVLMAAGHFYPDTILSYHQIDPVEVPLFDGYRMICAYEIQMESESGIVEQEHRVRVLADQTQSTTVAIWSDQENKVIKAERDGRYLVFTTSANNFAVLEKGKMPLWLICLGGGVVLMVCLAAVCWFRKHKRQNKVENASAE